MKKIPSLYLRDSLRPQFVTAELDLDCLWVARGEGFATEKLDGTACMIRDEVLYKRYNWKRGPVPPAGYENADPDLDGHHGPGWIPVDGSTADQWHREAFNPVMYDGTYELLGPKVQRNPYRLFVHLLLPHGCRNPFSDHPCALEHLPAPVWAGSYPQAAIETFLREHEMEGIVWHHPDGRMAKIKSRDFGIEWPRKR